MRARWPPAPAARSSASAARRCAAAPPPATAPPPARRACPGSTGLRSLLLLVGEALFPRLRDPERVVGERHLCLRYRLGGDDALADHQLAQLLGARAHVQPQRLVQELVQELAA